MRRTSILLATVAALSLALAPGLGASHAAEPAKVTKPRVHSLSYSYDILDNSLVRPATRGVSYASCSYSSMEDVIRSAFIYKLATVVPVGVSPAPPAVATAASTKKAA